MVAISKMWTKGRSNICNNNLVSRLLYEYLHWSDYKLTIENWIDCISKIPKCLSFFLRVFFSEGIFFKHQVVRCTTQVVKFLI